MRIRYYFFVSLLYILLVSFVSYYITDARYELRLDYIADFAIDLPVAGWVMGTLIVFFLISLAYILSSSVARKFHDFTYNRDYNKVIDQINHQILSIKSKHSYTNENFRKLANILDRLVLIPVINSKESGNEKIDAIFDKFNRISNGEALDLKNMQISAENPYYLLNLKNLAKDHNNSHKVLTQKIGEISMYPNVSTDEIYREALQSAINSEDNKLVSKLVSLPFNISYDILEDIVKFQSKTLLLNTKAMVDIIVRANISKKQYLSLAILLVQYFRESNVQFWLGVFERLKDDDRSVFAYFYILLGVGKIDEAKYLKSQFGNKDFPSISAYIELKDKGYPLLSFFDPLQLEN